jgi:CRISPR-associated exonuclease Cas4
MASSEGLYLEDDLLPISALQHLQFCERQWALIHLEQQWEENRLTAEGRILHDRVHDAATESRPGVVIARGLLLHSLRLGLTGQADVVEFHRLDGDPPGAARLPDREGWWRPFPIEYKRGRPKPDSCDEVQLCAQALCLEEMFGVGIENGALFYGKRRRRTEVPFDGALRKHTEELARRMHDLYCARITPPAVYEKKCDNCSLYDRCLPRTTSKRKSVGRYLATFLKTEETEP